MKHSKNGFFGKTAGIVWEKFQQISKNVFSGKTLYNGSQLVLLLKNSQKAWILGLTAKLHGCFSEKKFKVFKVSLSG